jgi:hypothetical protein
MGQQYRKLPENWDGSNFEYLASNNSVYSVEITPKLVYEIGEKKKEVEFHLVLNREEIKYLSNLLREQDSIGGRIWHDVESKVIQSILDNFHD